MLAFIFGYALTLRPLLSAMSFAAAMRLALAADTASITVMEVVDNIIMLVVPGAMDAGLASVLSGPASRSRSRLPRWPLFLSIGG